MPQWRVGLIEQGPDPHPAPDFLQRKCRPNHVGAGSLTCPAERSSAAAVPLGWGTLPEIAGLIALRGRHDNNAGPVAILNRIMHIRLAPWIFILSIVAPQLAAPCFAQTVPSRDQWGERFNSPGAKLSYKEIGRNTMQGRTIITYSLFASGLPKNQHYVLCILNVGSDPKAVADAYLNGDGKVVNVLADAAHHIAEDPINAKVFGGKGEPIQLALISDNNQSRAFAQIVPFPLEETAGPCHLSLIETGPYYSAVLIRLTGFQPDEEFTTEQRSENEGGQAKGKADSQGSYNAAILPFVKGKRSGKARFVVSGKSCKIGIEFPWGEGSYQYQ